MDVGKHCPVNEAYQYTSPLISVDIFKQQCTVQVSGDISLSSKEFVGQKEKIRQEIQKLLNTDTQTIEDLEEVCNTDNLECDFDQKFDYTKLRVFEDFPEDSPLHTVRLTKLGKTKQEEVYYAPTFPEAVNETFAEGAEYVNHSEVILHVSIYHAEKKKIQQEYYVLPQQRLTELRDLITCQADNTMFGEYSHNPDLKGVQTAKDITYSSFFFIEQCFYNDTRNPLNRDYSRIIVEWAKASERYSIPGLGLFQSTKMEDKTFKDLQVRLGYPYLFCHQGNCEHLVVFTDMRLRTENDPKLLKSYPFKINIASKRHRRCSVCKIHLIKWMTTDDTLAFENPSFFCEKCFRYLHYDQSGQKMGSFKAYPYIDPD